MKMPDNPDHEEKEAGICPGGTSVTGVQVMRGRNGRRDADYFNFKLRCGKQWASMPLGLAFDGLRETRSATCPSGASLAGLRVHRGFQDWGDLDTYEFQLFCTSPPGRASVGNGVSHAGASGYAEEDHGGRGRPSKRAEKKSASKRGGSSSGDRQSKRSPSGTSAFGSRGAEFDAIAEQVRNEMAAAARAKAAATKDEL